MKILWLSHLIPYPPKGGALQRTYNLIKELSRYHEIDLMAFNQRLLIGSLFDTVEKGVGEARQALKSFCERIAFFNIESERFRWGQYVLATKSLLYEPYTINWLKSKKFGLTMKDWLERENYDLIHFDTISLLPFYSYVPPLTATSLDHHNIESHMLLRRASNEKNKIKRFYFWQEGMRLARYEGFFCPKFTLNLTCSDVDSKRLTKLVPNSKICNIPNGVDLNFFKNQKPTSQPNRLIFVGRMNSYPNIEAVLYIAEKLWPVLKQKHPKLECDIVGSNPPSQIRELANRFSGFNVHGYVDDVRPYIEAATIYVCPIKDGGGTKLKILDAMAMSKAIVAHPIACEGIKVKDNHNVLLADNKTKFLEHIDYLLGDSQKRESLGREARRLMEEFYGYQAIGKKLSEAFQNCLK